MQILRLDSAPAVLTGSCKPRSSPPWVETSSQIATSKRARPKPEGPIQDALASDTAIAHALPHRGPLVPRDVGPAVAATLPKMSAAADAATDQQTRRPGTSGRTDSRAPRHCCRAQSRHPQRSSPGNALLIGMWRSLVRPDASAFRFGVQRAVAVGLGVTVLSYSAAVPMSSGWSCRSSPRCRRMRPPRPRKAAQAAVGTWEAPCWRSSLVVPPKSVLVPWLAIAALVIGSLGWPGTTRP